VLTAVAPIVGTARVVSSAGKIARALGLADLLDEEAVLADGDGGGRDS
jgi:hypothetical protein